MINFISHCELRAPSSCKHFYNRLTFINVPHHLWRWTSVLCRVVLCGCLRICIFACACACVCAHHYISVNNILAYNKASRQINGCRYIRTKVIAFAIRCQKERIEKEEGEKCCHCRLMIIIVKLMQTINMLYAWVRACVRATLCSS